MFKIKPCSASQVRFWSFPSSKHVYRALCQCACHELLPPHVCVCLRLALLCPLPASVCVCKLEKFTFIIIFSGSRSSESGQAAHLRFHSQPESIVRGGGSTVGSWTPRPRPQKRSLFRLPGISLLYLCFQHVLVVVSLGLPMPLMCGSR